jgi:hypothetical protein
MPRWLRDAGRRACQRQLPLYGQCATWVALTVASYTQLLAAHAMFIGVEFDGKVMTPAARDHIYPTAIALLEPERHQWISLLSFLPFDVLFAPGLYATCLSAYFVFATLWALQIWPRWSPLLAALFYTLAMSLFWENAALIAEWWSTVNVILIVLAAWYWFYADAIEGSLRAGTFWKTPLFPQWAHELCVFAIVWFFTQAGWRKLLNSGLAWTDGVALQLNVHWAMSKFGPTSLATLQELLLRDRSLAGALASVSLAIECTAFFALLPVLFPRLVAVRWAYGVALCGFFVGVTALFGTWYFEALFAMVVLFLWPFERWLPRWVAALSRRGQPVYVAVDDSAWGRIKRGLITRFDLIGRYKLE